MCTQQSPVAQRADDNYYYSGTPLVRSTPFAPEKWPFKRGGLLSGVEIYTFMFRFTVSSGLSRGVGLSSGWPLKRSSTVLVFEQNVLKDYKYFL